MWLELQLIFPQVTPDAQSQLQVSVYNLRHQLHQLLVIASGTDWIILWLAGLDTHTSQCFERQLPTMLEHGIGSLIEQVQWISTSMDMEVAAPTCYHSTLLFLMFSYLD